MFVLDEMIVSVTTDREGKDNQSDDELLILKSTHNLQCQIKSSTLLLPRDCQNPSLTFSAAFFFYICGISTIARLEHIFVNVMVRGDGDRAALSRRK